MNICCIKGCENEVIALELCDKHYRRNKLYGSPAALKSHSGMLKGLSAAERFEKQHVKDCPNGCWEWTGALDADGYGRLRGIVGTTVYKKAHRYSWAYHSQSEIPEGMSVCHSCDNTRCVNPAHLWVGNTAENQQDKWRKGRGNAARGEAVFGAKLTADQVREILESPTPHSILAQKYGVTTMTISDIKCRRSWAYVPVEKIAKAPRVSKLKGVSKKGLTPEIVCEIRTSTESGVSLAAKYNVSKGLICNIRKGRSWTSV